MKVIQYGYTFYPHYGGEETYILALSKFLEKNGFKIVIIQRGFKEEYENIDSKRYSKGITIEPVNFLAPRTPYTVRQLLIAFDRHILYPLLSLKKLNDVVKNGDVIVTHYPHLFFPSAWLFRKRCKTICVSHGVIWDNPNKRWTEKIFYSFIKLLHKIALRNCDLIVANDKNYAREAKKLNGGNVKVIPNFVDTNFFKPGRMKKRRIIICARNLQKERGIDLLIEAVKDLNVELWIAGDGPERKHLESLAGDNVKFFGRLDRKQLLEKYRKAMVAVVPSRYGEGTSLSALEAMSSGLPVVVTNVGGLPDLVEDGVQGFVVRPDSNEIRKALLKIFNSNSYKKMSKAARKRADEFSYQKWCDKWLETIKSL